MLIAVDGPAASGNGTIAVRLAAGFALPYLNTGLLYRAVGVFAGEGADAATTVARGLDPAQLEDPALRTREAGELASRVGVLPEVRATLLDFQRRFAARAGVAVLDGRDIRTVIAPDAAVKLFVTASPEVRAEQRWRQLLGQGEEVALEDVLADIRLRDARQRPRRRPPSSRPPTVAVRH